MVENLEIIEAYFNNELAQDRKNEFDRRITTDPVFAEEVSFYLSSKQVAAAELEENKSRLAELYRQHKQGNFTGRRREPPLRQLWPWVAAAAVLAGVIFGWYTWFQPVSPAELANKYITENFQSLPVNMGGREDSLQTALRLYNDGRGEEALKYFESMVVRDTSFAEAKKYAGIVSLRLGEYDKAISYFSQLANYRLFSNPGKFYEALTLMKRNQSGDNERARQLLQEIVENDLEGKEDAEEWLKKW